MGLKFDMECGSYRWRMFATLLTGNTISFEGVELLLLNAMEHGLEVPVVVVDVLKGRMYISGDQIALALQGLSLGYVAKATSPVGFEDGATAFQTAARLREHLDSRGDRDPGLVFKE